MALALERSATCTNRIPAADITDGSPTNGRKEMKKSEGGREVREPED
ncbi:uncharacterized protein DNG_02413 [Cephalotrichum gorgonifer]|uniref:Uncharacterized protein n=1 Tax=Cephalotrichum gorgonifer TaxID=2041049 RepID=A0AAE8SSK9_9PEZI|nr:uncharacterized protein DNG_02413 [Cephalotrichum gorgonifer]